MPIIKELSKISYNGDEYVIVDGASSARIDSVEANIGAHVGNRNNPHAVTAAQLGISATNSSVTVNGTTFNKYEHPTTTPVTTPVAAKIGNDNLGHVIIGDNLTAADVGAATSGHTHGNITNDGKITSDTTIATGDKVVVINADDNKVVRSAISFDTSKAGYALTQAGTWAQFNNYTHPTATATNAAAVKVGQTNLGHVVLGDAITASDIGAAASTHTHSTEISAGGTSPTSLSANTTYTLKTGGTTFVFKTPVDTQYTHPSGTATTTAAVKVGSDSLGHVVLGDAITASDIGAATSGHNHDTVYAKKSELASLVAATDAMVFKGTLGTNGTITSLPADHTRGDTYRVITPNTYAGVKCEEGDLIICLNTGTTNNNADWTVAQTNIDGAVIGPSTTVDGNIAIFDGTSGKLIKDSNYKLDDFAIAGHKHTAKLETSTATTGVVDLTSGGTYKLTAGGNEVIFSMPISNAYTHPTTEGYKHIPAGGTTGQYLKWDSAGTATWANLPTAATNATGIVKLGTGSGDAAQGNHTHTASLADGGSSDQSTITLAYNKKYKLTAGGNSIVFTTPIGYSHPTTTAVDAAAKKIGKDSLGHVVIGDTITPADIGAATSGHTHTAKIESGGSSPTALSASTTYTLTAGGKTVVFTTPVDTQYTHPSYDQASAAAKKIGRDTTGHVVIGDNITAADVGAATSNHTHTASIAEGGSSPTALAANTTYTLTAGGKTVVFTTPTDTKYTHPTYDTANAAAKKIGRDSSGHVVIGDSITASDVGAATSSHTHTLSIASGGSGATSLSANTTYTLTAGGKTFVFKTPVDTQYTHPTTTATSAAAKKIGKDALGHVVIGDSLTASDVGAATSGHTHTTSLTAGGTATVNLSANTAYTLTAGGTTVVFKTPADGNTDTKVNVAARGTTKSYLMADTTSPTSTAAAHTAVAETGIYMTTTAGELNAKQYKVDEAVILQYNSTTKSLDFIFA